MSEVKQLEGWAAMEKGSTHFEPYSYTKTLGENDVEIRITYSGMCASDYHQVNGEWGPGGIFPMVPGHEIVGNVVSKGSAVTDLEIGDRVGVGAQVLSCMGDSCNSCSRELESYCPKIVFTYNSKYENGEVAYGGYAKGIVCHSHFAVKIPDALPTEKVPPLFCAGVTVFDPMDYFDVRNKKVAVIGIGGLGHLAVKFAVALGNEVVGVSRTDSKKEDCMSWGCSDYIPMNDPEQVEKYKGYFDAIVCTVNGVGADWDAYFSLIGYEGTFIVVGLPPGKFEFNAHNITAKRVKFAGSMIGSPAAIVKMLDLAAEHNILPDVQVWPVDQLDEAWESFLAGKPRYRYVLHVQDE
eukprot:TRINITY_DN9046_c0_g1_i1.p1 TRINITY_DN9046_c0_g1~~TRINITY_DN9046_c0_g1_i1.p1  ORF type:complete len:362 (-),score=97.02 TRINITY_DN9046_c0_g1_i1:26-1081(-)